MSNVNNAIQFLSTLEISISAHILPYVVITTPIATRHRPHKCFCFLLQVLMD